MNKDAARRCQHTCLSSCLKLKFSALCEMTFDDTWRIWPGIGRGDGRTTSYDVLVDLHSSGHVSCQGQHEIFIGVFRGKSILCWVCQEDMSWYTKRSLFSMPDMCLCDVSGTFVWHPQVHTVVLSCLKLAVSHLRQGGDYEIDRHHTVMAMSYGLHEGKLQLTVFVALVQLKQCFGDVWINTH